MNKEIRRIPLNLDYLSLFKTLKLEQVGEITLSVMGKYANGEKIDIQSEITKAYAMVWCNDVDIAISKKTEQIQKNRINGSLGGKAKAKNRQERGEREQAEQQDEDTAPPSYEVSEAEQVESYPFDEFWRIYDKNVGKRKCQQIWKQISEETKAKIMAHVVEYVKTREKRLRKDPCNYFAEHTWEDEIISNNQSAISYGSNNGQQDGRTQQQINIERNAQAVARMFNEIRPMQPEGGGGY